MRMNADGSINKGVLIGQFYSAVEGAWTDSGTHRKDVEDASSTRASDHVVTVGIVAGALQVSVGIDKHDAWSRVSYQNRCNCRRVLLRLVRHAGINALQRARRETRLDPTGLDSLAWWLCHSGCRMPSVANRFRCNRSRSPPCFPATSVL